MPKNENFYIIKDMCYNVEKIGCDFMAKEATKDGMHWIQPFLPKINCIYILDDRTCQCKDCYYFLGYCTDPDVCPYKVKEGEEPKRHAPIKHRKRIVEIDCSLADGTVVYGRGRKVGVIHHYEKEGRKLYITFGKGKIECLYPDSFQNGALSLRDGDYILLANDIAKAKVK